MPWVNSLIVSNKPLALGQSGGVEALGLPWCRAREPTCGVCGISRPCLCIAAKVTTGVGSGFHTCISCPPWDEGRAVGNSGAIPLRSRSRAGGFAVPIAVMYATQISQKITLVYISSARMPGISAEAVDTGSSNFPDTGRRRRTRRSVPPAGLTIVKRWM